MKLLQWLQVELQSKLILRQRIAISIAIFITFHKVQPIPSQCLAEAKGWATFELRWVSPRYTSHPGHSSLKGPKRSLTYVSLLSYTPDLTNWFLNILAHACSQSKKVNRGVIYETWGNLLIPGTNNTLLCSCVLRPLNLRPFCN